MTQQNQSTIPTVDSVHYIAASESISQTYTTRIIDCVIAGIAVYVFIVQWIYYWKFGWHTGRRIKEEFREAILLSISSILTCSVVVSRIVRSNAILQAASVSSSEAGYIDTFHCASLIITYNVLWLRQRAVHTDPTSRYLSNAASRFISKYYSIYTAVIAVIVMSITVMIYFIRDCRTNECFWNVCLFSLTVLPLICHLPLLYLMLTPLYKYYRSRLSSNRKCLSLVKRVAILTILCLVSEVVTILVLKHFERRYFYVIPLNMVVNLLSVIMIQNNWTVKVFPFVTSSVREVREQLQSRDLSRDANPTSNSRPVSSEGS